MDPRVIPNEEIRYPDELWDDDDPVQHFEEQWADDPDQQFAEDR